MDYKQVAITLQNGLKDFLGNKKAVIGISGGIDSAVVAALCVNAVGKDKVVGVQLPYGEQSIKDGTTLINHLGLDNGVVNIKSIVDSFMAAMYMVDNSPLTNGNVRARCRMTILYAIAGGCNGLVIGTGNKTEMMLGYFTKWGDGGVDVEAIGNLYKTEVFELARYLRIPSCIINKSPSAELWDNQTDEGEIGMSYVEMDSILIGRESNHMFQSLVDKYGEKKVNIILSRIDGSEHKRNMPITLAI